MMLACKKNGRYYIVLKYFNKDVTFHTIVFFPRLPSHGIAVGKSTMVDMLFNVNYLFALLVLDS